MADSSNIPLGLKITTQIPLDVKQYIQNEATLINLGVANNLAYTYVKGSVFYCIDEGTRYEWREVVGVEQGLMPTNFTYSNNIVAFGITYSNKVYNFFRYYDVNTYSIVDVGTGAGVYKDSTASGYNTQFNLKSIKVENVGTGSSIVKDVIENTNDITTRVRKIKSSTLDVSIVGDDVVIENPVETDTSIPRFIVNKDYTGTEELGTIAKPFKTIEAGLLAFKGSGTNVAPQYTGSTVFIQRASTDYIFTGNINYNRLVFELEAGAVISSNPSVGDYLIDYDSMNVLNTIDSTIVLNEGSRITLIKKGFKNSGTTGIYSSYGKILRLKGTGTILNFSDSIVSASTKCTFESNYTSTVGYVNPNSANFYAENVRLISYNSPFIMQGGSSANIFKNINFEYCSPIDLLMNSATPLFDLKGGSLEIYDSEVAVRADSVATVTQNITVTEELNGFNIAITFSNTNFLGVCNNFLYNKSATALNDISLTKVSTNSLQLNSLFVKTDNTTPQNVDMSFCSIGGNPSTLLNTETILVGNSINEIASQVIATLPIYASKNAAVADGLSKGSLFVNQTSVNSGSFIVGVEYKISTIGDTNFTLIGASANTVGLYFTASGVGIGTGTASLIKIDIVI
jgi:hypothetical protein